MRSVTFTVAIGALVTMLACNGNTSRTEERAPTVATNQVSVTVKPVVAWPAPSTIDEAVLDSLSRDGSKSDREVRALVGRSAVPVLAPKGIRLTTSTLVVEAEYFTLTGRVDGATISLQGTRAAHRYEGVDPAPGNREVRGAKGFVSTNEGIRTASWIENGVAYSVDVECSDSRDERCRNDGFLLQLVNQLVYVGGSGR